VVVAATAIFALAGIGTPLLGLSVFTDTGSLAKFSGYRDVLAGVGVHTDGLRDQVDAQLPNSILFGEALRSGTFAAWDPYAVGGAPLAGTPNLAIASPLSLPYWILPGWLAPAYTKLLELICAIGGMYLFLRRLRLRRSSAWLGGLVFASSAFMVVWTGWPQTRVAALIPVLFWATERIAQRVRVREVALVALAVTAMLLGGFPAVTGYALLTAGVYLVVRVLADYARPAAQREPGQGFRARLWPGVAALRDRAVAWREHWRRQWRPVVARLGAGAAGVAIGAALTAWQLLPWLHYMSSVYVQQRAQEPDQYISAVALLTAIAPDALGGANPGSPPTWFGPLAIVDAESYVGGAALVLVFVAIALAGSARRLLPRGIWWVVGGAAGLWASAIYLGGPLLALLQELSYLFGDNFVGRARSVLGFLLAVLAAVGFEVLLRRAASRRAVAAAEFADGGMGERHRRRARAYGIGVWTALVATAIALYIAGRDVARLASAKHGGQDLLSSMDSQLALGVGIVVLAGACVAWLWFGRGVAGNRWARPAAAITLVVLIAGQALWWVAGYYPRTDKDDFYPTNPTQQYLAAHLGHQRFYGTDGSVYGSVDAMLGLRSYQGHSFIEQGYADLAQTLPGDQFPNAPTTTIISPPDEGQAAASPVLDRAAVSYYVTPPDVTPFGSLYNESAAVAQSIAPGQTLTVPVPKSGPVRAVGLLPEAAGASSSTVEIELVDPAGRVVATNHRAAGDAKPGVPWLVPLAAEDVPAGTALTARITVTGETGLIVGSAGHGQPALSVVSPTADNLRLVYAQESTIYQRTSALPRARWASSTLVTDSAQARVALLAGGLSPTEVVLDAPGPSADGAPAEVTWVDDGLDQMVLHVQAQGAGYLVLADTIQSGWRVSVDGVAAPLVPADHAFAAVAVGPGSHTVRFYYPGPLRGAGALISALTALALLSALAYEGRRRWLARLD
jgi:hypothetical protein